MAICGEPNFEFFGKQRFFDIVGNFDFHIRLPQDFLHQNLSFPERFQLRTFLLGTDLSTVPKIYLLLLLYINRSITKYFLIETFLEMIDSTCPWFFMLESVLSIIVLIGKFFVMDRFRFLYSGNSK